MYIITKKKTAAFCTILLAGMLCTGCPTSTALEEIQLNGGEVLYNGKAISADSSKDVYSSTFVEYHEDVAEAYQDTANTIVHITKGGVYQISGEATNTQIRVTAPEEEVTLVLNDVNLSCHTAPAILIESAADPQKAGEAGVTIALNEDSTNTIHASHVAEYTDENGIEIDYDGAISSKVSLKIEGNGTLQVTGDKEGIESQMHLTINGGNISVASADDPINASEDGVSVITINDGIINCSVQNGAEGDGIDSNGYIYINGGSVLAQSHGDSMDSGLDADLGIVINGGTVCATGNMYEEISEESAQSHAQFYFAEKQKGNTPLVVTDTDGNYVLAYTPVNDYTILEFSLPDMTDGTTYYLYSGGTITGTLTNGIYTEVTSYEGGTQMGHRGIMRGGAHPKFDGKRSEKFDQSQMERPDYQPGEAPQRPQSENGEPPERSEGEMPKDFDSSKLPEGLEPNNLPQPPQGEMGGMHSGFNAGTPLTPDFVIDSQNRVYAGIAPLESQMQEATQPS